LKNKDIIDLIKQEDTLNDYLASFPLIIETNKKLLKIRSLKLNEEEKEIIKDLEIDLEQTLTNCKFVLKNISNMRDYYSTTLSGNLNKIITVLTVFTVLLTIPTTISGIYGMNISLPGQNLPNFFWFLTILVFIIWFILLVILRQKRVLD
jgi:magnesium transporter